MMLPVIEALTTSMWCARSATIAMISSAALPNVALRKPPSVGPDRLGEIFGRLADQPGRRDQRDRRGDEDPERRAARCSASHQLIGAATSRTLSQLEKSV